MKGKILIVGATGKTGRLTLDKMSNLGQNITIGGRDNSSLEFLARKYDVPYIVLDIKDKEKLIAIFKDFNIIINLVGPFINFGYIPVEAAIAAKVHYLDSSWEQEFIYKLDAYRYSAIENNVAIIPGVGVSPGISDLMVAAGYKEFDECHNISIYYVEGMKNRFSYGTLISAANALKSQSLFFSEGQFVPIKAGDKIKDFVFNNKYNHQILFSYPSGDIVNIPRYIKTESVECFFGVESLTRLFLILGKLPFNTDSIIIRTICKFSEKLQPLIFYGNIGFTISVEINGILNGKNTTKHFSIISDEDPYSATSNLLTHAAKHLIESKTKTVGITSLGQAFNSIELLNDSGLNISF